MELKIYNPTENGFIKEIEWNHEEIKKEVAEKVEIYKNLVYTEDDVKSAKEDRAKLNKFVTVLETKRKEIKKQCLEPYEKFEKQMKEITAIVNEPIGIIDKQLKEYEEIKKAEKRGQLVEHFAGKNNFDWLEFEKIFDQKWLNASVSLKRAQTEIEEKLAKINDELEVLSKIPEFSFEAIEVYKSCLDLLKATNEAQRMSEIAKCKAEEKARRKAEEEARAEAEAKRKAEEAEREAIEEAVAEDVAVEFEPVPETETKSVEEVIERKWINFSAFISVDDAKALKEFFEARNIEFKRI